MIDSMRTPPDRSGKCCAAAVKATTQHKDMVSKRFIQQ
jgi:hypothetical protein